MAQLARVTRCYFGLGDHEHVVRIRCKSDFLIYIWARNVDITPGGVQVITPPSQHRGSGSTGDIDGLVLDVPAQSGVDLGCIGGKKGETLELSNSGGVRVTVFLTILSDRKVTVATS